MNHGPCVTTPGPCPRQLSGVDAPGGKVRPFRGKPAKPDAGMNRKTRRNRCDLDPQTGSGPVAIRVSRLLSSFANQTCPMAVSARAGNSVRPLPESKARLASGRLTDELTGQVRRFKLGQGRKPIPSVPGFSSHRPTPSRVLLSQRAGGASASFRRSTRAFEGLRCGDMPCFTGDMPVLHEGQERHDAGSLILARSAAALSEPARTRQGSPCHEHRHGPEQTGQEILRRIMVIAIRFVTFEYRIVRYRTLCKAFLHLLVCCADGGFRQLDAASICVLHLP